MPLVEVRDLVKHFPVRGGVLQRTVAVVQAVDGVSFDIARGETLGLVGESGCGKTTVGRLLLRLIEPTSGTIRFDGQDITTLKGSDAEGLPAADADHLPGPVRQPRPQDAHRRQHRRGSPDPRHRHATERRAKVAKMMDMVGLQSYHARRYPHEFSGGQRQRIGIARALVLEPDLVVCDEPVSALDVSIQAQVLNLLKSLQRELGLTYVFVAHNMGVVEHISDRVAVMYLGRIAEIAERIELFRQQEHPYTVALMSAIPVPDPEIRRQRVILTGDVPSPVNPPSGCRFHPRCPLRKTLGDPDICATDDPPLNDVGGDHLARVSLPRTAMPRSGVRVGPRPQTAIAAGLTRGVGARAAACVSAGGRGRGSARAAPARPRLRPPSVASLDAVPSVGGPPMTVSATSTVCASDWAPPSCGRIDASAGSGVPRRTGLISMWLTPTSDASACSAKWQAAPWSPCEHPDRRVDRAALLGLAESLVEPAAGVEPAALGRVDRARHVAGEDDPPALALEHRVRDRHGGQERAGVRVSGRGIHEVGRPDLDDLAEIHHRDPVADVLDDRKVVGDEQVRQSELRAQVREQVEDLGLDRHIERRDRLVTDDELGLDRERPGDADALPLAAAELVRIAVRRTWGRARRSAAGLRPAPCAPRPSPACACRSAR